MIKIYFFTKYTEKGPSSRYRSYQYESYLKEEFEIEYLPFFGDEYIDSIYYGRSLSKFKLAVFFVKRIKNILSKLFTKNIIFIEYELVPYFPPIFEYLFKITGVKYILDYDDAIFHNYDNSNNKIVRFLFKNKIKTIAKYASHIITGSPYLTSFFSKINDNVMEIPTSIKFQHYQINKLKHKRNDRFIIGWLGSSSTSINLIFIKDVINQISNEFPNVIFQFCGFKTELLSNFNSENIELVEWSTSNEMKFLSEISIGIMPLEDSLFNKGKCGFKLIQYMAMSKPTIATPLEANVKINRNNANLFASSAKEWYIALKKMITEYESFKKIGAINSEIIQKFYSVEENSKMYIEIFNSYK